jgi:DNA-binding HxlR family transcriptional regulator
MAEILKSKARIDILALLAGVVEAEFQYVKKRLRLSDGNLSSHLTVLEEAGCVKITKTFVGKKPKTYIRLTSKGEKALLRYLDELSHLMKKDAR